MGWIILIAVIVLLLIGFVQGSNSEPKTDRSGSDERAEDRDDEMLEDWYTSQELDNDLDDWDR
jgi:hypothetical protein